MMMMMMPLLLLARATTFSPTPGRAEVEASAAGRLTVQATQSKATLRPPPSAEQHPSSAAMVKQISGGYSLQARGRSSQPIPERDPQCREIL